MFIAPIVMQINTKIIIFLPILSKQRERGWYIMTDIRRFGVWDYVVFSAMLAFSAIIGIYSALSGGRQSTADEVLLGNRRLNPIAVGLSIMASSISAIAIIATPAEIYNYNTMFGWVVVSYIPANLFISIFLLPVYGKLKITSIYEVKRYLNLLLE